jgi:hypothetical protein
VVTWWACCVASTKRSGDVGRNDRATRNCLLASTLSLECGRSADYVAEALARRVNV